MTNVFASAVSISLETDGDANAILTGIKADVSSNPAGSLVERAKVALSEGHNTYASLREYIDRCVVVESASSST